MAATARFDMQAFIGSLEPGISVLVIKSFKDKLNDKLNGIIDEVHEELCSELPDEIKVKVSNFFSERSFGENVNIEVDLKGSK